MNKKSTEKWQRKLDKLNETRLIFSLRKFRILNIIKYFIVLLFCVSAVIFFWVEDKGSFLDLFSTLLLGLGIISSIYEIVSLVRRPVNDEFSLFRKYGSPELVVHNLKKGSHNIIYETTKILFTETYILEKGNYSNYLPYENIKNYYINKSIIISALSHSKKIPSCLEFKDIYNDIISINITENESKNPDEFLDIIRTKAPDAQYKLTLPEQEIKNL